MNFKKALLGSVGLKLAHNIINFLISIYLARFLQPDGFGTFTFIYTVIMICAIPGMLGLPQLLTREIARYEQENRWGEIRGVIIFSLKYMLAAMLIVITTALIFINIINISDSLKTSAFVVGMLLVPVISINYMREAILIGVSKIIPAQIPEKIITPIIIFSSILIAYKTTILTVDRVVIIYVIAGLISLTYGLIVLYKLLPDKIYHSQTQKKDKSIWIKSVMSLSLISGLTIINSYVDIIMLGIFRDDEAVGVYKVSLSLSAITIFIFSIANSVASPKISKLFGSNKKTKLQNFIVRITRLTTVVSFILFVAIFIFSKEIIIALYGSVYLGAYPPLLILAFGYMLSISLGPCKIILNMTRNENQTAKTVIFAFVLNVFLNLILIPKLGTVGAAFSTSTTLVFSSFMMAWIVKEKVGIGLLKFRTTTNEDAI